MKRGLLLFALIAIAVVLFAQAPRTLSFSGVLTDAAGEPITGETNVTVSVYDAETGSSPLWTEAHTVTPDSRGNVTIILGTTTPLDIDFDRPLWLGVVVGGETLATRLPLSSSPYSLSSVNTINEVIPVGGNISFAGDDVVLSPSDIDGIIEIAVENLLRSINHEPIPADGNLNLGTDGGIAWDYDAETGTLSSEIEIPGAGSRTVFGDEEESGAITVQDTDGNSVVAIESTPGSSQGLRIVGSNPYESLVYIENTNLEAMSSALTVISNSGHEEAGAIYAEGESYGLWGVSYGSESGSAGVYGEASGYLVAGVIGRNDLVSERSYGVIGAAMGTELPEVEIGSAGVLGIIESGFGAGVTGVSEEESGYGIGVLGSSQFIGVEGRSASSFGVHGISESGGANPVGVKGIVRDTGMPEVPPIGVMGAVESDYDEISGVKGEVSGSGVSYGVWGITHSSEDGSAGVKGEASGSSAVGVLGQNLDASESSYGVKGIASGTSIDDDELGSAGVIGILEEGDGAGVIGKYTNVMGGGIGVLGSSRKTGVEGRSEGGTGVRGISLGGAEPVGVVGTVEGVSHFAPPTGVLGYLETEVEGAAATRGWVISDSAVIGVEGYVLGESERSIGVFGRIGYGNGIGVMGENLSEEAEGPIGVFGLVHSGTEHVPGVGVFGTIQGEHGYGVEGTSIHPGTAGVVGNSLQGIGVLAESEYGEALKVVGTASFGFVETTVQIDPAIGAVNINDAFGNPLTVFGGPSDRVAIQTVNSVATPSIPDNNFIIAVEDPLVIINGTHGITITCPECCTEPCEGGGGSPIDAPCVTCDPDETTITSGDRNCISCEGDGTVNVGTGGMTYNEGSVTIGGGGVSGAMEMRNSSGDVHFSSSEHGAYLAGSTSIGDNLHVWGTLSAERKHFIVPHPTREGMEIVFTSTESDQVNIEHKGVIHLVDGYGEYPLPEEFILMSEAETYQILCTPQSIDSPANIGAVVSQEGIVRIRDFNGGNIPVAFEVKATRKGHIDFESVREAVDHLSHIMKTK